jgi:hypothetical protein
LLVVTFVVVGVAPSAAPATGGPRCRVSEPRPPKGPSAKAVSLGTVNGHEVDAVVYPRPDDVGAPRPNDPASPWSQWGQGLVLDDGRFLSAAGDHRGPDGNSHLYVYDPRTRRITRFADVLSQVRHTPGDWGYGKIHAQLVAGSCNDAYLATYWGTARNIRFSETYRGDHLFRVDTRTLELERLGVPLHEHGIPTLGARLSRNLLFGEAVTPTVGVGGRPEGSFFAYDVVKREVVFRADDALLDGFRNVLVGPDGSAYVAGRDSRLLTYRPGDDRLRVHPESLGGGFLRASTAPAPDGTVYGATQDPNRLFALHRDGRVESLGSARGYTTSLALAPDGDRFFYVPGATGRSWQQGTPLIAVDTKTGEQTVIAELNEPGERTLGLTLGGSYDVAVDPSGERVYVGLNAGPDRDDPWGEVVLVTVDLT